MKIYSSTCTTTLKNTYPTMASLECPAPACSNNAPRKIGSKEEVFSGQALRTSGGLKKEDLMECNHKIISKKRHEHGKKAIENLKKFRQNKKEAKPIEEKKEEGGLFNASEIKSNEAQASEEEPEPENELSPEENVPEWMKQGIPPPVPAPSILNNLKPAYTEPIEQKSELNNLQDLASEQASKSNREIKIRKPRAPKKQAL